MKRQNVKLILVEPYFDLEDTAEFVAGGNRRTGSCAHCPPWAETRIRGTYQLF